MPSVIRGPPDAVSASPHAACGVKRSNAGGAPDGSGAISQGRERMVCAPCVCAGGRRGRLGQPGGSTAAGASEVCGGCGCEDWGCTGCGCGDGVDGCGRGWTG